MLSDYDIETIVGNFSHQYFLHNEMGEWEQITEYGKEIPKIIRKVVKLLCGYLDYDVFNEIMEDINNIKTTEIEI